MGPDESTTTVLASALRRAFDRPSGWLNGIAGFLARGGILLFVLPI